MGIIAKIYPNGEASLYYERMLKKKGFEATPRRRDRQYRHYLRAKEKFGHEFALGMQNAARRGAAPLGLVTVPISTKNAETPTTTKGLTRLGARTLRQGAFLIEQGCGKDCVTFATCTLPVLSDEEYDQVEKDWSNIIDRLVKRLRYHLQKSGLSGDVIHVTEVHPKRSLNEGREIPHLHLVFQGRRRKSSWSIAPSKFTKFWHRSLQLKRITRKMCLSSCQLARVKKSVSRYLSKYVAKKQPKTFSPTSQSTLRKLSLKQWWGISDSLRDSVRQNTRVLSDSKAEDLWRAHEKDLSSIWEYLGAIKSPWNEREIIFCRFGRLTKWAREKYLRSDVGEGGTRKERIDTIMLRLTDQRNICTISVVDNQNKRGV